MTQFQEGDRIKVTETPDLSTCGPELSSVLRKYAGKQGMVTMVNGDLIGVRFNDGGYWSGLSKYFIKIEAVSQN